MNSYKKKNFLPNPEQQKMNQLILRKISMNDSSRLEIEISNSLQNFCIRSYQCT